MNKKKIVRKYLLKNLRNTFRHYKEQYSELAITYKLLAVLAIVLLVVPIGLNFQSIKSSLVNTIYSNEDHIKSHDLKALHSYEREVR